MTDTFLLRLDRTPPSLTWGPVTGAEAGSQLSVRYTLDEGAVDTAVLVVRGGAQFTLTDDGHRLYVNLPQSTADGTAEVRVTAVDDVGNAADYTLRLTIEGYIDRGPSAPPPRFRRHAATRVDSRSGAVTYTRTTVRTSVRHLVIAEAVTTTTIHALVPAFVPVDARSAWRSQMTRSPLVSAAVALSTAEIARTSESPAHEEELLLMLL